MSKPSLRRSILVRSVQRLLPDDEQVTAVVIMWDRHRLFFPYVAFAGVALFVVALVIGVATVANQLVIGGCGAAVAAMATTQYVVLAETTNELVLCRSSRIRQHAKHIIKRLPASTPLAMAGSTVVTSDWKVDGTIYTLTKRWEATMRELAANSDR